MARNLHSMQDLSLDAALSTHMGDAGSDPIYGGLTKVNRARMTRKQRRQAEHDAARNRVTYDLAPELDQLIEAIAKQLSVPRSQVASYLMLCQLDQIANGKANPISMWPTRHSKSMRYDFNLTHFPEVPDIEKLGL